MKKLTLQQIKENKRLLNKRWIKSNRAKYNASKYIYRSRLKYLILSYYSGGKPECAICKNKDIDILVIDHINNDGAQHRKKLGISSRGRAGCDTYQAIKKENFPDGLQVLCANCNMKKEMLRKEKHRMKNLFYVKKLGESGDANTSTV